jgi:hypothetical protein
MRKKVTKTIECIEITCDYCGADYETHFIEKCDVCGKDYWGRHGYTLSNNLYDLKLCVCQDCFDKISKGRYNA